MGRSLRFVLAAVLIASAVFSFPLARAQKPREPLTEGQVTQLLQGGVAPKRVARLARESGIAFEVTRAVERALRAVGADDELLQTLRELAQGKEPAKPKDEAPHALASVTTGFLLITTDAACKVEMDGEDLGELAAGASKRETVPFGEHLIRAVSTEAPRASVEWTGSVEKPEQTIVRLKLADRVAAMKADLKPTPAPDGRVACSAEKTLRSGAGEAANVEFINRSQQWIRIFWLDGNGERVLYKTLTGGESYVQGTFVGHPWVITNMGGECQSVYVPTRPTSKVEYTGAIASPK